MKNNKIRSLTILNSISNKLNYVNNSFSSNKRGKTKFKLETLNNKTIKTLK